MRKAGRASLSRPTVLAAVKKLAARTPGLGWGGWVGAAS